MPVPRTSREILDADFLSIRHRLLDLAADFDRLDRGHDAAAVASDPRLVQLLRAAALLTDEQPDRAERVQMVFSDTYDERWRSEVA